MALLDEAARQRIEATIREVEATTASELVVVSVRSSDDYHDVRLAYAFALALAGSALVHLALPALSIAGLLWIQVALAVAAFFLLGAPALLRVLVPRHKAAACVHRRAELEFLEHRVYATRDNSGVLILLSELEHRVVVLGDSGIYSQLQAAAFEGYVDRIIAAIRGGRAADGVCEVLRDLGQVLATRLPRRPDDVDELPNVVAQEET